MEQARKERLKFEAKQRRRAEMPPELKILVSHAEEAIEAGVQKTLR